MVNLRLFHIYQFVTWPSVRSTLVLTRCPRASENVTRRGHMRDNPIWYYVNGLGCLRLRGVKKAKIIHLLLPKLCAKHPAQDNLPFVMSQRVLLILPSTRQLPQPGVLAVRYNLTPIVRLFFVCPLNFTRDNIKVYISVSDYFFLWLVKHTHKT